MTLRPDLQEVLDAIATADRTAAALARPLSDEQFYWQPDGGRAWGVAQCLDHLATANDVYGRAMEGAVTEAEEKGWTGTQPIASSFFGSRFVQSLEPPVTRRTRAPGKIKPVSTGSRDDIMRAFAAAHDRIRTLVARCRTLDVNRATFANPFLPLVRMRLGTAFRIVCAHDRRHLWQAGQVTKAPGFPSTTG